VRSAAAAVTTPEDDLKRHRYFVTVAPTFKRTCARCVPAASTPHVIDCVRTLPRRAAGSSGGSGRCGHDTLRPDIAPPDICLPQKSDPHLSRPYTLPLHTSPTRLWFRVVWFIVKVILCGLLRHKAATLHCRVAVGWSIDQDYGCWVR